jgi:hypothetical protein
MRFAATLSNLIKGWTASAFSSGVLELGPLKWIFLANVSGKSNDGFDTRLPAVLFAQYPLGGTGML